VRKITVYVIVMFTFTILIAYQNTLEVRTDFPDVKVYLDEEYLGSTQQFADINVLSVDNITPGTHRLKCTYLDYEPYGKTINIPREGTHTEEVNFGYKGVKVTNITGKGQGQQLRQTGTIIVRSKPTGATIALNNRTMTSSNNEIILADAILDDIPVGSAKIKCSFGENKILADTFYLAAGDTVRVLADFFVNKMIIDTNYRITIASDPAGEIFIDGIYKGNGSITTKLGKGEYLVKIKRKGYKELKKRIQVNGHDLFTYELEPNSAPLNILTKPTSGANVYLNEIRMGTTPFYEAELEAGTYFVEIKKEGWITLKDTIKIIPDFKIEKTYQLKENSGTVKIIAPSSMIFINGEKIGNNEIIIKITPGSYQIKATREKHYDDTKKIIVKLDDNSEYYLKPSQITGTINVSAKNIHNNKPADGLSIFCNGSDSGEKTTADLELMIGEYEISLQHHDYPQVSKKIKIEKNDQKSLVFKLESYSWYKQKEAQWKKTTRIGLAASALLAGGGIYCNMKSNDNFEKYEKTAVTEEAMDYKKKTQDFESYRDYCWYAASGVAFYTFISWIKSVTYSTKTTDKWYSK
jgi:hypothetical protein